MIYVTGAAGFIGSHLVNTISANEEVVCCDVRDKSMVQPEQLISLMESKKPSVVYHLGAISSTTETNTREIATHNILFSCELLEYCIKNDIPMIYASSASVYGLGDHGFNESAQLTPLNYYAISKASFDMFVLQKLRDNPIAKIYGLRYFNVYGENEGHKGDMASPVHKFLKQSHVHGIIKVFEGSENFFRDFVYVGDVVNITLTAATFRTPGIYNVGTSNPASFMDVAKVVSNITKASIIEVPFPTALKSKYQEYTCSDNAKINNTGYSTERIAIAEGIEKVFKNRGI